VYQCFTEKRELRQAIEDYLAEPFANSSVAQIYGYPMNDWCVEQVTDMSWLFSDLTTFDVDISKWNTSGVVDSELNLVWPARSVEDASNNIGRAILTPCFFVLTSLLFFALSSLLKVHFMFQNCESFKQDIGPWDVSNVKDFNHMFSGATTFRGWVDKWDVSSAENMQGMFSGDSFMNKYIAGWDVSKVRDMSFMFERARAFNMYLGDWNTGNVEDFSYMFFKADRFDRVIGSWNTAKAMYMTSMFEDAVVYNRFIGWDTQRVRDMSFMFSNAAAFNYYVGFNTQNVRYMVRSSQQSFSTPRFTAANGELNFHGPSLLHNFDISQTESHVLQGN